MIIASDNQATNQLIDLVDPSRKRVSATMNEIVGNSDIRLYNAMYAQNPQRKNQGSARAFAMLLKRIEEGQVISPGASARMKAIMGLNADDSMIQRGLNQAGLQGRARLYNKTGGTSVALNDAGIIEVGDRRYVLSIFTPQDAGGKEPAERRLAAVTRDLVQFLEARQAREATDPTAVTAPTSSPERP
jgi:beta-lactamase class A